MPAGARCRSSVNRRRPLRARSRGTDWHQLVADLLGILAVPVGLVLFHYFGSVDLQELLTYISAAPTLHGLFGHWAVHYSGAHLLENAVGYGLFAGLAYLLAWSMDDRRWFRLSMATILLVVPALSAAVSSKAFAAVAPKLTYRSRGASAVVAAVLGLTYVLSLGVVRRNFDLRATVSIGGTSFIAVLTVLLVQSGSVPTVGALLLPGIATVVLLFDAAERIRQTGWQLDYRALLVSGSVVLGVTLVMGLAFLALFPTNPFAGTTITNVFAHAAGFVLGTVVGVWGRRYWTVYSWI